MLLVAQLNTNLANGEISFSVVDGDPYVKVGADSPRPFNIGKPCFLFSGKVGTMPMLMFDSIEYYATYNSTDESLTIIKPFSANISMLVCGQYNMSVTGNVLKNGSNIYSLSSTVSGYTEAFYGKTSSKIKFEVGDVITFSSSSGHATVSGELLILISDIE